MADYGYLGETTGYPFPRPFQPNVKARRPLANTKKSVIKKVKPRKPIVKRGK